jgi:hypothetical protein
LREQLGRPPSCENEIPSLRDVGGGHQVACHFDAGHAAALATAATSAGGTAAGPVPGAGVPPPSPASRPPDAADAIADEGARP